MAVAISCFCGFFCSSPALAQDAAEAPLEIPTALFDYVNAADDSYRWTLLKTESLGPKHGTLYTLELISQTWQGIVWKHELSIVEPVELKFPGHALLYITGGSTGKTLRDGDKLMGAELARMTGAYSATLIQVPNQPLMDGRYEDDLITETFLKYVETRDPTWPLLFPMAKSAVAAMDAIGEFAGETNGTAAEHFTVTGASKRGWTTWLTGVVDPRVLGIAPMVIDTLNMPKQSKYQVEIWGKYSEQIIDYTSKGLVELMEEQPEIPLFEWVDPYTYRKQLRLPKLVINGTNDPYWVVDALNNYWDDLEGEKYILYIPNAGHGLDGGRETVVRTFAAFSLHLIRKVPFPELRWKFSQDDQTVKLTVESTQKPTRGPTLVGRFDRSRFSRRTVDVNRDDAARIGRLRGRASAA